MVLENEFLKASFKKEGAELISLIHKATGEERLWHGDGAYWARHAPVLFPFVGKVNEGHYRVDDKVYAMGQHGFARDRVFDLVDASPDRLTFRLVSDQETLNQYPFHFTLHISYHLSGETLEIGYEVINKGPEMLPFGIGAHPAFLCPLEGGESQIDYIFEFEKEETASIYPITKEGLLKKEKRPYLERSRVIAVTDTLFEGDALVFEGLQSKWVRLKNPTSGKGMEVGIEGFPFLGLWSKPEGAPFICIEPWHGHADFEGYDGDLKNKADQILLETGQTFNCLHTYRPF